MTKMNKLEFIQTIRQLIADGKTDDALTLMRVQVSNFDTSLITDSTMLESRYNTAFNDFTNKGILPRADYDRTVAQINYALLEIVEKLEKSAPLSTSTAKSKNSGRILHTIPGIMPVGKERRCIVRIAYDDETLLRDLKVDENTTIENVRIAEVMGVELVDFNETPAFSVRTITEEEQFISADDYTQWLFMVKALREGKFPLTLKVAVIEEVNGKERKRDIVLEKEIFIISNIEEPVPAAAPAAPVSVKDIPPQQTIHFEDTSIRFNYVVNGDNAVATTSQSSKRFSMSGIMSTIGVIVMAMVGWVTFQTFKYSSETPNIVINKGGDEKNMPSESGSKGGQSDTSIVMPQDKNLPPSQIAENGHKGDVKTEQQGNSNSPVPKTEIKIEAMPTPVVPKNEIVQNKPKPKVLTNNKGNVTPKTEAKSPFAVKTKPKTTQKPPIKPKPKPEVISSEPTSTPVTEPKIQIGDVKIVPYPTTVTGGVTSGVTTKEAEVKTYRVRLVLKGEMKKAEISVDGQSVDQFLKKNIWGTPQYIEFKSSKERHTITFKRGDVSCSVTDVLIENGDLTVEPCSF